MLLPAINNHANGRYILAGLDDRSRALVFRDVGPNIKFYDPSWRVRTRGLRLRDQPDYAYGSWIHAAYRETMLAEQPTVDDVDVNIQRPRKTEVRLKYSRLLLPLRDRAGNRLVLSASHVDPTIDLRVGADEPTENVVDEIIGRHAHEPKA